MKNSKEWFSVSELLEKKLSELPTTSKGISKRASREEWERRQRLGVKGKTYEYHYSSFPKEIQLTLGFTPEERKTEVVDYPDEFLYVQDMSIKDSEISKKNYAFRKDWLAHKGLYPLPSPYKSLIIFKIKDDTMEPTLKAGDFLLVNMHHSKQENRIEAGFTSFDGVQDGLYVVRIKGRMVVRRIQLDPQGGIHIYCDNSLYNPIYIGPQQADPSFIVGRVEWYAHSVNWE